MLRSLCAGEPEFRVPGDTVRSCVGDKYHMAGWRKLNQLSQPNETLGRRKARASGENLNYVSQVPQGRQARPSGAESLV